LKKFAIAAVATAAVAVPAVALAGPTAFTLTTKAFTTTSGTTTKPRSQQLTTTFNLSPAGDYATSRAVIRLDKTWKFSNKSKFPSCTLTQIRADEAKCNVRSKVGTGTATAVVAAANNTSSNLDVTAFNGPGQKLFLLVETENPLPVRDVMDGTLKSDTGKYGRKLDVVIPQGLQQVAGFRPTLTKFQVRIGATYKNRPYITTTGCTRGKWSFAADLSFSDGSKIADTATSNCKKGS
jgi:hypothetical protein